MGARWYDPYLARWLSADTVVPNLEDPQSLNRFSYVRNNPLGFCDETGHFPIPPWPSPWAAIREAAQGFLTTAVGRVVSTPHISAIVGYALYRQAQGGAVPEALELTTDWYFEKGGPDTRIFGPEDGITQHLMSDKGVNQAREKFVQGGGEDMTGRNPFHYSFDVGYFTETPKAFLRDDFSGSFLGSYDVSIVNVGAKNDCQVHVTVENDTGWASATRIPFTPIHYLDNVPRSDPGPGGTLWQYYEWTEKLCAQ